MTQIAPLLMPVPAAPSTVRAPASTSTSTSAGWASSLAARPARRRSVGARILRVLLTPIRMLLIVVWSVLFVFAQAVQGVGLIALFIAARIKFDTARP